jgi:hypothetical protein
MTSGERWGLPAVPVIAVLTGRSHPGDGAVTPLCHPWRVPPFLSAVVRGAGASLAVLSAPLDRRALANAQGELFERRRRDLETLRTWRELEPRLTPEAVPAEASGSVHA